MIYRLRATIPSSKVFVREYEIPAKISLFDFNKFIINDLCFSSDQIVVYRALDEKGAISAVYGLFDLGYGSMDKVTFEQLAQKGQNVLQFCYDMHNNSCIVITILSEEPEDPRSHYPQTVLEKGHNPDQFSAKYEDPQVYIPRASGRARRIFPPPDGSGSRAAGGCCPDAPYPRGRWRWSSSRGRSR
ncbi:MAG: hypothetical protein J6T09_07675, partial [Bacteroidales bacterium]|nr:hypothetical protein [Bacteroidales bacterium]